jgi:hypothetical protein
MHKFCFIYALACAVILTVVAFFYTPCIIYREQVGNLSTRALQFARFKRKRLGASKYSNLIFERFIGVFSLVFSANQKIVNLLHCCEGEEGMKTFRG